VVDPAFYQGDHAEISRAVEGLEALETELAQAYQRWFELEG